MTYQFLNLKRIFGLAILVGLFLAGSGNFCFAVQQSSRHRAASPGTVDQQLLLEKSFDSAREKIRAEVQAEDQKEIDRTLDGVRFHVNVLIAMIGFGVTAFGLFAFSAVKLSRNDVTAGLGRLDKEIEQSGDRISKFSFAAQETARSAVADARAVIKGLEEAVEKDVEDFKGEIRNDFPEIGRLKERLQELLFELERTITPDKTWSTGPPYGKLTPMQRERILVSEATVNAMKLFVSDKAPENRETLSRLYLALARFYLSWFRHEPKLTHLADRAEVYVSESNDLTESEADGWVLCSAIYLSRFQVGIKLGENAKAQHMRDFLREAQMAAERGLHLESSNLGASVNLALAFCLLEDLAKAVETSEEARQRRGDYSDNEVSKSMGSLYVNLACYKARQVPVEADPDGTSALHGQILEIIEEGYMFFKNRGLTERALKLHLENYFSLIEEERKAEGDLTVLGVPLAELMERLRLLAQRPRKKADG